jgi:protein gp37
MAMKLNIGCTIENQESADYRLPLYLSYPIKRRFISSSTSFGSIDISTYIVGIEHVTVGGETDGKLVYVLRLVLDIRNQCVKAGITFCFKNTVRFQI